MFSEFFAGAHAGVAQWVAQLLLALFLTLLANQIARIFLNRLQRANVGSHFLRAFIPAATAPLRLLIWMAGVSVMLKILQAEFSLPLITSILATSMPLAVAIGCWFMVRLKNGYFALLKTEEVVGTQIKLEAATVDLIEKMVTAIIVITGLLLIMPTFGFSINGLLAFGGVGGIMLGLATKDMLSNVFGTMSIHIDRPFNLGDWISLPEKKLQGNVEHIGWRQTVLRTFDKRLMYVPNAMFGTLIVENPSRMTHRRIYETIGLRYDDMGRLRVIVSGIRDYLLAHPDVDKSLKTVVHFSGYNDYSIDILVSAFTRLTEWDEFMAFKEEVLLAIGDIIMREGAEIASPAQVTQIKDNPTQDIAPR